MASKKEKSIGIIAGLIVGCIKAYQYCENNKISANDKWKYFVVGGSGGSVLGYYTAILLGSPNDTVNYRLLNNGKLVYHGITFEDRQKNRKIEHLKRGLIFNKMLRDKPKARLDALILEKKRIKKHRPFYNIQHNNDN